MNTEYIDFETQSSIRFWTGTQSIFSISSDGYGVARPRDFRAGRHTEMLQVCVFDALSLFDS